MLQYHLDTKDGIDTINVFHKRNPSMSVMRINVLATYAKMSGFRPTIKVDLHNCTTNPARQLVNYFMQNPLSADSDQYTVRDVLVSQFGIKHH